jgi:hypothetical protein
MATYRIQLISCLHTARSQHRSPSRLWQGRVSWSEQLESWRMKEVATTADIAAVLAAAGTASAEVVVHLTRLLDRLDELLIGAGFDANAWYGDGA